MNSYAFKSSVATTQTGLSQMVRDPLITGSNNGIRFMADLSFGWCYPGGSYAARPVTPPNPVNGATIYDMSGNANSTVEIASADTGNIVYAGGGFDFTGAVSRGDGIVIPASVMNDIYTAISGVSQKWLICTYIKTPSSANWGTTANQFINWDSTDSAPLNLSLSSVAGTLVASWRGTGATYSGNLVLNAADIGSAVIQVAAWKDPATGNTVFRVRGPATGTISSTNTHTDLSDVNYSAISGQFGAPSSGWVIGGTQRNGFRIYRVFVDNLARDTRAASTILDADYTATLARGVFS